MTKGSTNLEQAAAVGVPTAAALAARGNAFVFGPGEPPEDAVEAYRVEAEQVRKEMRGQVSRRRRLRSDIDVRPLFAGGRRSGSRRRGRRAASQSPAADGAR